jgi:L-serine dehydratase
VALSAFDLFSVGIGPSSSHTVGPMRAAGTFVRGLHDQGQLAATARVRVELFGSLGATGQGHGSRAAVVLGLLGEQPELVDTEKAPQLVDAVRERGRLPLLGVHDVDFAEREDVVLNRRKTLPAHPNGMRMTAYDGAGRVLVERTFYSVGGGFVVDEAGIGAQRVVPDETGPHGTGQPYPYRSAAQLLEHTRRSGLSISDLVLRNECVWRSEQEVRDGLLHLWSVMQNCVRAGCEARGQLPGGLRVRRRAGEIRQQLQDEHLATDPLRVMDWVMLFALAVNEQNAAGGRVVTAPTNGAAGIVPAVLHYYARFVPGADDDGIVRFLLTATAIGILFKENASISGAEVGCQGEVGSACSMAAAGLAAVLGGTPEQVENAAEIGMEHNLGLTCDPIGGLVQIPCIERNAIASVKAITAARMALRGDGEHHVSLDKVIRTMRDTGADMKAKYKETSRGGLAVNLIEC